MLFLTLRRVSLAVLIALVVLSLSVVIVNQRALARPSAPNTARSSPGGAPCDTTLQACIDGSSSGDIVNIAPGLYITSVTLSKAVSLIGAGAGSTILQRCPLNA